MKRFHTDYMIINENFFFDVIKSDKEFLYSLMIFAKDNDVDAAIGYINKHRELSSHYPYNKIPRTEDERLVLVDEIQYFIENYKKKFKRKVK